jgi:hypothetical protein
MLRPSRTRRPSTRGAAGHVGVVEPSYWRLSSCRDSEAAAVAAGGRREPSKRLPGQGADNIKTAAGEVLIRVDNVSPGIFMQARR